jgi:hypothetical protein
VDDVPVADVRLVVVAAGDVHVGEFAASVMDRLIKVADAPGKVEGVQGAEHAVGPVDVQATDDLYGAVVGLGEVIGVGFEVEVDAVPLEVLRQVLHRLVERVLGLQRLLGVPGSSLLTKPS